MVPKNLKPLVPYLLKYRWGIAAGFLWVVLTNTFFVVFPQLIRYAVDDLAPNLSEQRPWLIVRAQAWLGLSQTGLNRLIFYVIAIGAVIGCKAIFQFLTRWQLIGISREVEFDLRNDLFKHLERLPYSYYQRNRVGDIMARATNDLNAVRMLLGPAIMYSANTIMFTALALYFMFRISPHLTLYAFLPLPIASVVVQYFAKRIHERFERIQAMFSDISALAQENFSGARVVRAYVQENAEVAAFERANEEYIRRSLNLVRLIGMLWPTLEFMLGLGIVLVLWLGGREVVAGRVAVGAYIAYLQYILMLMWPVIALGWVISIFQRGTASMGRINEILVAQPDITDAEAKPELRAVRGDIEFRNLNFAYDGKPVLHDLSLTVPAGTSLAIVGPTGSGKTSLVSLIPRIYDAPEGTVLIDGRPVREYPLDVLRRNIGFVPQETFLFSATIRENIAFGVETASDGDIRAAAAGASIATEIESFPKQYETMVGERGITLSGGQKQRTAIARALVRDPRILVLDDALSSVDTQTEDRILSHLREVMQGRTTIFISHRVSTVQAADQIAVLHDGRIVELGTHDELIARNGYYTDLYQKQLLEEELETV
jgi:ATP-binding cassette, subfamily B, multidrug efflux pump